MKRCHAKYYSSVSGSLLQSTGNTYTGIPVAYNIQSERKMGKKTPNVLHFGSVKTAKTGNQRVTFFPSNHNEAKFTAEQGTKVLIIFPEKQGHNQSLPTTSARNVKPEGRPLQL